MTIASITNHDENTIANLQLRAKSGILTFLLLGLMPMRKDLIAKRRISIMVDPLIMAQVEKNLQNPITGSRQYGALSELVERLLVDWLQQVGFDMPPMGKI